MNHSTRATQQTVVINATNIGSILDGIGTYGLNILRELGRLNTDHRFIVYLNTTARQHFMDMELPVNFSVRWVWPLMSPDFGFRGHLIRLIFANLLGLTLRKALLFNISQLEAVFFRSHQILTIHDLIPLLFKKCHRKQFFYYKYFLKYALRRADVLVTPSAHTKELLAQKYPLPPAKIRIVPNGVPRDLGPDTSIEKEQIIVYVGRIVRMKNVTGVLKAFALMKDKVDHKLIIAGNGREALKKEFEAGRLSRYHLDRVVFKGYVPTKEMHALLKRASLLVFPSFYEGFGLPPLEAMSCGCPVVVSNVASLPEVCGDAAYYVDPHDVESIAHGMYTVLSNDELRQRLIEKGYQQAKLFRWDRVAESYLRLFNEHASARSGYAVQTELSLAIPPA